ncbi:MULTISPECIES: pilus assembly protein TadG-related protein [unclassified Microbacterium]|uniref:pilus assembly protein TadG-related protein n=1 Tax=unclassified Microbacterium TaxID=2609290 RepID=UPI0038645A98
MRRPPDDDGSVLLLTIGYALLALVLVFVCVDATSLYLEQKRTQAIADAAALAGADGFTLALADGEPRAELSDAGVRDQADAIVAAYGDATVVDAASPDGSSARVTVTRQWRPPIVTLFVPDGVRLEATATSRTALR